MPRKLESLHMQLRKMITARPLPVGWRGAQADLAGAAQRLGQVDRFPARLERAV